MKADATLCMMIAGLGIQVECTDPDLLSLFAERYHAFLGRSDASFPVRIEVMDRSGELLDLSKTISFRDERIHFNGPGVNGCIDAARGQAELGFSSRFGFELSDYFLRVVLAVIAFRSGGLMLHAAGIVRRGQAYLFFGHSGSGKTTVSRLSTGDLVLNDDLVVLMPTGDSWQVHATPFWNPSQFQPAPGCAELAGFFRLVQDQRVYLDPMPASQATAELIANIPVIPAFPGHSGGLLSRVQSLALTYPCYHLHFLPDASFWQVIDPGGFQPGKDNLT